MNGTVAARPSESSARALKIGLLGSGIGGSRTPRMHLAAAEAAGLPYEYHLVDSQVRSLPDDPAEILALLESEGFDGLNVTYPYKRAVLPLMDDRALQRPTGSTAGTLCPDQRAISVTGRDR